MNAEQIKVWLGQAWKGRVAELYKQGVISNKEMLLATMYDALNHPALPELEVWLFQKIQFPAFKEADFLKWETYHKKKELQGSKADLLVTYQNELKAVLRLNFAPYGYGDYRQDLGYLDKFHGLRGEKGMLLKINPFSGAKVQEACKIGEDLLLIYAVVNREASMSLEMETLKKYSNDPLFWYNFVLFQGIIGVQKVKFRMK